VETTDERLHGGGYVTFKRIRMMVREKVYHLIMISII